MDTPEGKIFRFVRPVAPEIFDRVAFERELKGNFASRGPSLRRGAHQKPRRASVARRRRMGRRDPRKPLQRAPGDGRRPPRPPRAAVTRARAPDLTTARERRRAVEWENSVLKVKIDQNENFQITRHS